MKRKNLISTATSAIGAIIGLIIHQLFLLYKYQLPVYFELVQKESYSGLKSEILLNMFFGSIKTALSLSLYVVPIIMLIIFFYGNFIYKKLHSLNKLNVATFLGSAVFTSLLLTTLLTNRRLDTYFLCLSLAIFPTLFYWYAMAYQSRQNA